MYTLDLNFLLLVFPIMQKGPAQMVKPKPWASLVGASRMRYITKASQPTSRRICFCLHCCYSDPRLSCCLSRVLPDRCPFRSPASSVSPQGSVSHARQVRWGNDPNGLPLHLNSFKRYSLAWRVSSMALLLWRSSSSSLCPPLCCPRLQPQ